MAHQTVVDAAKAPVLAFNAKDWDATRLSIADAVVYDEVGTNRISTGANDVLILWKSWAEAFPDIKGTFESVEVSGNRVILEITWRGTHKAPLRTAVAEIPATGKRIEIRACQIVDVVDGKVELVRQYFDMATMMRQLGL
jgi:steroid delta-isomerase-like uncharacterized protein